MSGVRAVKLAAILAAASLTAGCALFTSPADYPGQVTSARYVGSAGVIEGLHNLRPDQKAKVRVVVLPGTPSFARVWARVASHAPADWDFIAVDRPGFHGSADAMPVGDFDAQAAAIADLLKRPEGGELVLVGECYAAPIALRAAQLYPDKVDSVVLVDSYFLPLTFWERGIFAFARSPFGKVAPGWLQRAGHELAAKVRMPQIDALWAQADKVKAPVMIVHGAEDWLASPRNADAAAAKLGDRAEVVMIPGAWHLLDLEAPGEIVQAIARGSQRASAERSAQLAQGADPAAGAVR